MKRKIIIVFLSIILFGCTNSINNIVPTELTSSESATITVPTNRFLQLRTNDEKYEYLLGVIKTNGDCELPCILGFNPGFSDNIIEWISSFGEISMDQIDIFSSKFDDSGSLHYIEEMNKTSFSFNFEYYRTNSNIDKLILYTALQGDYDYNIFTSVKYKELSDYYSISSILKTYGKPQEIYLAVFRYDFLTKSPYDESSLIFYYPELSFFIEYFSPVKETDRGIEVCPATGSFTVISWEKGIKRSLNTIVSSKSMGMTSFNISYFMNLQESVGINEDQLFQKYIVDDSGCLYSPVSLWPRQ